MVLWFVQWEPIKPRKNGKPSASLYMGEQAARRLHAQKEREGRKPTLHSVKVDGWAF